MGLKWLLFCPWNVSIMCCKMPTQMYPALYMLCLSMIKRMRLTFMCQHVYIKPRNAQWEYIERIGGASSQTAMLRALLFPSSSSSFSTFFVFSLVGPGALCYSLFLCHFFSCAPFPPKGLYAKEIAFFMEQIFSGYNAAAAAAGKSFAHALPIT